MTNNFYCLEPHQLGHIDDRDLLTTLIGGKAVNLSLLEEILPGYIPPWFAITSGAYEEFYLKQNTDVSVLIDQLRESLKLLQKQTKKKTVVVRSSATLEDTHYASMAGLFKTEFGVTTPEQALLAVIKCWETTLTHVVKRYLDLLNLNVQMLKMGVVVQTQLNPLVAGIMFTTDPLNGDNFKYIIESSWGVGVSVVNGSVTPDHYVVSVENNPIVVEKHINTKQTVLRVSRNGGLQIVQVPKKLQNQETLTENQIIQLVNLAKNIVSFLKVPQDIEWAIEQGKIYILQTRPITTGK